MTFRCKLCGALFLSRPHIRNHIRTVHFIGKFQCKKCNYSYSYKQSFKNHRCDSVKTQKTKYFRILEQNDSIDKYILLTNEKPITSYQCSKCDKKLISHFNLKKHKLCCKKHKQKTNKNAARDDNDTIEKIINQK